MNNYYHNYDISPKAVVSGGSDKVFCGYGEISAELGGKLSGHTVLVVECYPGVNQAELLEGLSRLNFSEVIHSDDLAFEPEKLDAVLENDLTNDRVFGVMTTHSLADYFYRDKIEVARELIENVKEGNILVYGVGASLVCRGDVCILADITRWEIQLRYRRGMNNWRTAKKNQPKLTKYKRGFFAEWRWADKVKDGLLSEIDYYLDMSAENRPAMVVGDAYRSALDEVSRKPFRLVPYFDPGVWGGDWMKTHLDLPDNGSNYAWCFDGVPEENSITLDFGRKTVQTPAMNLTLYRADELLGKRVRDRFGKEFPIRFDFLDTIHGQNLSLQVHPLKEYIKAHFNMDYTQDESYYILDTDGDNSCVYLGVKTDVDKEEMAKALYSAQKGEKPFEAEKYVNKIPVKKHDHVLIPAGTVHCSGAGTMVLEISATPYIFTFKMWDWGRVDLDGKPRPIHLEHGLANIQWDRDTEFVKRELIDAVTPIPCDDGKMERTGLHKLEFIETVRVTTSADTVVKANGSVHMINLVEGERALIKSTDGAFVPFELHYAETCVIPSAAGDFILSSPDGSEIKVMMASVRK